MHSEHEGSDTSSANPGTPTNKKADLVRTPEEKKQFIARSGADDQGDHSATAPAAEEVEKEEEGGDDDAGSESTK